MKVLVTPIVIRALGIIHKNLEKWQDEMEINGRIETI